MHKTEYGSWFNYQGFTIFYNKELDTYNVTKDNKHILRGATLQQMKFLVQLALA